MLRKTMLLIAAIILIALGFTTVKSEEAEDPAEPVSKQPGYVGSQTCSRCHANTYATYKDTWHANILRPATDDNILGEFNLEDKDLFFTREEVDWVVGGQYKQRYISEEDGELVLLLSEWNILNRDWDAYVAGEWVAYEGMIWRKRPYDQYCAGCHTTGYNPVTQTWVEAGVGCESCHGPGEEHVASTGNATKIINPANLDFQDQVEVCAQCHSRGIDPSEQFPYPVGYHPGGPAKLNETFVMSTNPYDYWPDGTAKLHHMQYQDWQKGTHNESVSCIFCHTSHSVGETEHQTRMVGNDRCVICHDSQRDLAAHIPYMAEAADQVNCTDCHMPQISKLIPTDFQIKSHTFRPPNPALSVMYGGTDKMPNACNICHVKESPEWAAQVLGQQIPQESATPVPPPTPFPITSRAVSFSSLSMMSEEQGIETGFKIDAVNLLWIVLISVLSISVIIWIRRGG